MFKEIKQRLVHVKESNHYDVQSGARHAIVEFESAAQVLVAGEKCVATKVSISVNGEFAEYMKRVRGFMLTLTPIEERPAVVVEPVVVVSAEPVPANTATGKKTKASKKAATVSTDSTATPTITEEAVEPVSPVVVPASDDVLKSL